MTLEIYPPSVVTKFSAIKRVGPTARTNNNKIPAIIIFVLLSIFIPLSIPLVAEKIKRIVTIIITIICTHALLVRGFSYERQHVICLTISHNVVDSHVHIYIQTHIIMYFPM